MPVERQHIPLEWMISYTWLQTQCAIGHNLSWSCRCCCCCCFFLLLFKWWSYYLRTPSEPLGCEKKSNCYCIMNRWILARKFNFQQNDQKKRNLKSTMMHFMVMIEIWIVSIYEKFCQLFDFLFDNPFCFASLWLSPAPYFIMSRHKWNEIKSKSRIFLNVIIMGQNYVSTFI